MNTFHANDETGSDINGPTTSTERTSDSPFGDITDAKFGLAAFKAYLRSLNMQPTKEE